MQATTFESLRDLVLYHAAQRGWQTQRQVAVMCGLDESALSRFLNGEQDLGARRTHALFQAVGVPVAEYDLAYALLAHAQDSARSLRAGRRSGTDVAVTTTRSGPVRWSVGEILSPQRSDALPAEEIPASVVAAYFAEREYTGEQIAAFFAE